MSKDPYSAENVLAVYTTFDPSDGLFCEHCPELAAHRLSEFGNLCPKCLTDAIGVLCARLDFPKFITVDVNPPVTPEPMQAVIGMEAAS